MPDATHITRHLEGTPFTVGCRLNSEVITPMAKDIASRAGVHGVVEFYTALTTHLLCSIGIIITPEVAQRIGEVALQQVNSASDMAQARRDGTH